MEGGLCPPQDFKNTWNPAINLDGKGQIGIAGDVTEQDLCSEVARCTKKTRSRGPNKKLSHCRKPVATAREIVPIPNELKRNLEAIFCRQQQASQEKTR